MRHIKSFPLELVLWIIALVLLVNTNPHEHHFSLCPLANLGIEWCPGCGLGRSISSLFHGEIRESLSFHWFGIPAVAIIGYRIGQLSLKMINNNKEIQLKY